MLVASKCRTLARHMAPIAMRCAMAGHAPSTRFCHYTLPPSMPQQSCQHTRPRCPHLDGSMAVTMLRTSPQSLYVHSMPNGLSPYPSPSHSVGGVDHVQPRYTATTRATSAYQSYLLTSVVDSKASISTTDALGTATDIKPEQRQKASCAHTAGGERRRGGASLVRGKGTQRTRGRRACGGRARRSAGAPCRCW